MRQGCQVPDEVDPSYLKNTAETDRLTRLFLEQLMTAYLDAVAVTDLGGQDRITSRVWHAAVSAI